MIGVSKLDCGPILLVPPLMVTAQVYDISPPLSAVELLRNEGHDVWLCDFGIPERERGGMRRTLDQHIVAISETIDFIKESTGKDVHVAGYSQGGLFVYLAVAYRGSKNVKSIITFGSPVDFQRNLPKDFDRELTENILQGMRGLASTPLDNLTGLPGAFTSLAFKAVSPKKEVQYFRMMLGLLDDREALSKLEPMRRFLGGEGFVAWPGPAFRSFVDNVVVSNRLVTGGFVVADRTLSLSDLTCPILYFVGTHDEFARPKSVRAIGRVARTKEIYELELACGHFGLVVGSRAKQHVWPTVSEWVKHHAGKADRPQSIVKVDGGERTGVREYATPTKYRDSIGELLTELMNDSWKTSGELLRDWSAAVEWGGAQLPRFLRLLRFYEPDRFKPWAILRDRVAKSPGQTFFLWDGKAYSYGDSASRIEQLCEELRKRGVTRGVSVGVFMDTHPDVLTSAMAINALDGVTVLLNPDVKREVLNHALIQGKVEFLLVDQKHLEVAKNVMSRERIAVIKEIGQRSTPLMDCAEPDMSFSSLSFDAHFSEEKDLAFLMFTSGTTGLPKAAKISNLRWFMAAMAAAAGAGLTAKDTVYCCLPLHHATGFLLGVGSSLVGGARLSLSRKFSVSRFWDEVNNTGVTVVFYVGELCRYLVNTEQKSDEKNHSIRLFIGNGLRADVWNKLKYRFGNISVLEFYGATEGNLVFVNLRGEKIGSVGRVPFNLVDCEVVQYDSSNQAIIRDGSQRAVACGPHEKGVLLARIDPRKWYSRFEGYTDRTASDAKVLRNVFEEGDSWFFSGDLFEYDEDGDFWFVDRVGDTFRWKGENVSTEEVSQVVAKLDFVHSVNVYGVEIPGREGRAGVAAISLVSGRQFEGKKLYAVVQDYLASPARPLFVRVVAEMETTSTFKFLKTQLQEEGVDPSMVREQLYWLSGNDYLPLKKKEYKKILAGF